MDLRRKIKRPQRWSDEQYEEPTLGRPRRSESVVDPRLPQPYTAGESKELSMTAASTQMAIRRKNPVPSSSSDESLIRKALDSLDKDPVSSDSPSDEQGQRATRQAMLPGHRRCSAEPHDQSLRRGRRLFLSHEQQLERQRREKHRRMLAGCDKYEKMTELELIEDEMATSEEDDSVETMERKELEATIYPPKWSRLNRDIQLDILYNLKGCAGEPRLAISALKLDLAEQNNAADLLKEHARFERRNREATMHWTTKRRQYEEQYRRPLTRDEERIIMERTIMSVQGHETWDVPVKNHELIFARRYLESRGQDPDSLTLGPVVGLPTKAESSRGKKRKQPEITLDDDSETSKQRASKQLRSAGSYSHSSPGSNSEEDISAVSTEQTTAMSSRHSPAPAKGDDPLDG